MSTDKDIARATLAALVEAKNTLEERKHAHTWEAPASHATLQWVEGLLAAQIGSITYAIQSIQEELEEGATW